MFTPGFDYLQQYKERHLELIQEAQRHNLVKEALKARMPELSLPSKVLAQIGKGLMVYRRVVEMKTKIWLALFALYIAWGSTYLAIRFAVESIPPFFMAGTRFLIAGSIVYIWRRLSGDPAPTRAQWRSAAIIGLFLLLGGNGVLSWAEQHVSSGMAALLVASIPLWVVVIDAVRPNGTRPTWQTLLGVFVGLAGIAVLAGPTGGEAGLNLVGVSAVLLAAFLWAIGSIYGRGADLPKSPLLGTGMEMLAGSAGLFLAGLVSGEAGRLDLAAVTPSSLLGLAYLIVVGSLIGFVSYTWLLRSAPTSLVMTYAYVNPVVAVLLGSLLAQEALTPRVMVAIPVILVALALINIKRVKASKPSLAVGTTPVAAAHEPAAAD